MTIIELALAGEPYILGTVVVRWTAGEQVDRSILHQGHDS